MSANLLDQTLLDQFRVEAFVASGGMGVVYRVWDLKRNVSLAMKVLHEDLQEDPAILKRFQREARALQQLAHPNIVPFYGLYQTADFAFLLERFIDGPTLKALFRQRSGEPLPPAEALAVLKSLCAALGYAHAHGVVHCDVKPGNVMVDQGGNVYLTDFGIARHAESTTTTLGQAGSPAYMTPEQIRGDPVTPATDVYAMGVLLYEMLTGRRPFLGDEEGSESGGTTRAERTRYAHLNLLAPDLQIANPDLSEALSVVVSRALAKDPSERFQDAKSLILAASTAMGTYSESIADRFPFQDITTSPAQLATSPGEETPLSSTLGPAEDLTHVASKPTRNLNLFRMIAGMIIAVLAVILISFAIPQIFRDRDRHPLAKEVTLPVTSDILIKLTQIAGSTATAEAIIFNATTTEIAKHVETPLQALQATQTVIAQSVNATANSLTFAATATAIVSTPAAGHIEIESWDVSLWPEFDSPSVLVIYNINLSPDTHFPATLSFSIPPQAIVNAAAYRSQNGILINADLDRQEFGTQSLIKVIIPEGEFQFEFYDPSILAHNMDRHYDYHWLGGYLVKQLTISVQQPKGSTSFRTSPKMTDTKIIGDYIYHSANFGSVEDSKTYIVSIDYQVGE